MPPSRAGLAGECPLPGPRFPQNRGEVSPHLRCGGPEVSEGRVEGTALEGFKMTSLPPGFPFWGRLDSGQGAGWGRAEVETPLPSRPETKNQSLGPRLWPHLNGVFMFPFPCVCGSRVTHTLLAERVKSLVPEKQTSALPGQGAESEPWESQPGCRPRAPRGCAESFRTVRSTCVMSPANGMAGGTGQHLLPNGPTCCRAAGLEPGLFGDKESVFFAVVSP